MIYNCGELARRSPEKLFQKLADQEYNIGILNPADTIGASTGGGSFL